MSSKTKLAESQITTLLAVCVFLPCLLKAQAKPVEPEYCKLLQPSALDRLALPEWLLGSGDILKQQGCWFSYNRLGRKVLERSLLPASLKARLALNLASSAFYQGDYDRCLDLALTAQGLAQQQMSAQHTLKVQVESRYLQSAVARVRQQPEAVPLAEQALALAKAAPGNNDFLVAKSLYNLGAALTDVAPVDSDRAQAVFAEAEKRFYLSGNQYDTVRSVIRQARVLYLNRRYHEALDRLDTVADQLEQPRSKILFYHQRAKILVSIKNWKRAQADAEIALQLAELLGAEKDRERIRDVIQQIKRGMVQIQ